MASPILVCKNCGASKPEPTGDPTDIAPSEYCGDCPPWVCEECGETCSADDLCRCWVDLSLLPFADVKAVLAQADLAVGGTDGD